MAASYRIPAHLINSNGPKEQESSHMTGSMILGAIRKWAMSEQPRSHSQKPAKTTFNDSKESDCSGIVTSEPTKTGGQK